MSLLAAGGITLNSAITAGAGGLTLAASNTITATDAISVARFTLGGGNWIQNSANLPAFAANNFQIIGGSFLRAAGGDGSTATPYLLTDIYGVQGMNTSATYLAANYKLANDIDASGTANWNSGAGFIPVGNNTTISFTGSLNGANHTISGLTIVQSQDFVGLIGLLDIGGSVTNLGLVGGSVSGSGQYVGSLVGVNYGGTVSQSYATTNVSGSGTYVGGLVGYNDANGTISQSYATGTVLGSSFVGGLVGTNNAKLSQSYASGRTSSSGNYAGGLTSFNDQSGTIEQSYATGSVFGSGYYVGGLVGFNEQNATVSRSYASGDVAGSRNYIGGLVGYNVGTVSQSYANGSVLGSSFVGGLVGANDSGTVSQSYATGHVSGVGTLGGFVGINANGGKITASYWDKETTGQTRGVGAGSSTGAIGLTTAQARSQAGYVNASDPTQNLDFTNVWYQSGDMRPILRSEAAAAVNGVTSVANLHQLQLMGANLTGSYVLTGNIDASATNSTANSGGIFGAGGFSPIGNNTTSFTGSLNGANHTITGLTISQSQDFVGLIGLLQTGGSVSNLGLVGGSVAGSGNYVGSLVGVNYGGTISQSYATTNVSGSGTYVGGLVGYNDASGTISQSYATGSVSGSDYVGGLVGTNNAKLIQSYANGSVSSSGSYAGGLASYNDKSGVISQSYATGSVVGGGPAPSSNFVGGLVGFNYQGTVNQSYATGSVSGSGSGSANVLVYVGGLVGNNYQGQVNQSYATGSVSGSGSGSGNKVYVYVGGLVGFNYQSQVNESYATGSVLASGSVKTSSAYVYAGGLVGRSTGTVTQSYATGSVAGSGSGPTTYVSLGGLAGNSDGTISASYWDIGTTGQTVGVASGSGSTTGITGLSTRRLQGLDALTDGGTITDASHLGSAFSGGANGLYPYLTNFFPNGVQAVSGNAYKDAGATVAASGLAGTVTVSLDAGGSQIGQAITGANGYYYITLPSGTLVNGTNFVTSVPTNGSLSTAAATLATSTYAAGTPAQTGINLYGGALTVATAAATLSAAHSLATARANANAASSTTTQTLISGLTGLGLVATGAGFTIDRTLDLTTPLILATATTGASLTVANAITVESGGSLGLSAAGALQINAPITAKGAASVSLAYDQNTTTPSVADLSFAQGAPLSFTDATGNALAAAPASGAGALSINGNAYTLLYGMGDLSGLNRTTGRYALAGNLDASGNNYTAPVIPYFSGTLEGLGHTISNLTIAGATSQIGLIGTLNAGGTVRDLGLIGGSVSGFGDVGMLVGNSSGTVARAYATGSVTAGSNASGVGGLVGTNNGVITQSYATGSVTGGSAGVGGLVGYTFGTVTQSYATGAVTGGPNANALGGLAGSNGGTITQAYATGAVTGGTGSNYLGGLSGINSGSIAQAYATGAVTSGSGSSGLGGLVGVLASNTSTLTQVYATGAVSSGPNSSALGGLVGANGVAAANVAGGTITQAYWDTQTTGQTAAVGSDTNSQTSSVPVGMTTALFQLGAANAGLGSAFAGGANGLYPYLTNFFPNGVQAVSGTAYKDAGATLLPAGQVNVVANGATFATISTGANGYFYAFGAANTFGSGSSLLAYTQANTATGAQNAATYAVATSDANNGNLNVYGGWKLDRPVSTTATLSALNSFEATAAGASAAASFSLANRDIYISSPTFTLDSAVNLTGTLSLDSNGTVTQTAGTINAASLRLSGVGGGYTLSQGSNVIGTIAANTGRVALVNTGALSTGSIGNASGSAIAGVTTGGMVSLATSGSLTLASGAGVSGTNPVLSSSGAFINNAGANAVTASGGRWLIYSANSAGDTFGNLDSGNTAVWNTVAGGAVTQTGNRYAFAQQPTLTITTTNVSKIYGDDASANVAAAYTMTGLQPGVTGAYRADTLSGTPSVTSAGSTPTANVAASPYAITTSLAGLIIPTGYITNIVNTGLLTITPRALTITAANQSKVYGQTLSLGTTGFTTSGLVTANGDAVTGVTLASLGAAGTANVGSTAITASAAQGTGLSNYTIGYANGTLTVTPASLTITAASQSKVYGQTLSLGTTGFTTSGLITANGDAVTSVTLASDGAAGTATVANSPYAITASAASGRGLSNYNITYAPGGMLTVTPAALTITATNKSKVYGQTLSLGTTGFTPAGLINGDVVTGVTLDSLGAAATATVAGGPYAITGSNAVGTGLGNYNITYAPGTLTVTARQITITANSQSRVYGDANKPLTYTVGGSGLANNDVLTGALTTTATTASSVGSYAITRGSLAASTNYALTYSTTPVNLTVTARPITVTANAQSRVYGDANPQLTYKIGGSGLVNGDTLTGALVTSATTTSNVGSYGIAKGTLAASSNYNFYSYSTSTLTVTARPITITANAQSRGFLMSNPALTYSVGGRGLVNGDQLSGGLATNAGLFSLPGSYAITQGSLRASSNYAVNYVGANLNVTLFPPSPPCYILSAFGFGGFGGFGGLNFFYFF